MTHDHAHPLPAAPERLRISGLAKGLALLLVLVGAGAFAYTLREGHAALAWSSYLIGAFYVLGLGLFGVLWMAILYLTKAVWSVSMRRVPEAMTAWLVPGAFATLAIFFGAEKLYHWAMPHAAEHDALLAHKTPFLNLTMFLAIVGASLVVWILFARLIVGNSRRQDAGGGAALSRTNATLSGAFVVLYALTFTAVSYYLLMSLEPHWYSTIYAVLTFTDMIQTGTAFVALVVAGLMLSGQLRGFVSEDHLHSLAKMMFAATGFWAYIYFSQFLLIWYANVPEETSHFVARLQHGWSVYLLALPLVKFLIPFSVMAARNNKRKPARVMVMALLILVAQFFELYMLVSPAIGHGEAGAVAHAPMIEALVTLGFLGLFFLVFAWSLGRHGAVPLRDPRLQACLEYHQ